MRGPVRLELDVVIRLDVSALALDDMSSIAYAEVWTQNSGEIKRCHLEKVADVKGLSGKADGRGIDFRLNQSSMGIDPSSHG